MNGCHLDSRSLSTVLRHSQRFILLLFLCCLSLISIAEEREELVLDETCIVSILNRTVNAQPDGSWFLTNVPSTQGQVRARATCFRDDKTISGQTDFFNIINNQFSEVSVFYLATKNETPQSLSFDAAGEMLYETLGDGTLIFSEEFNVIHLGGGESNQLIVRAAYADGSSKDVSAGSQGTNFFSSNTSIATVSADGFVVAVSSGKSTVVALLDGMIAILQVEVAIGNDSDGDGLPDDYELLNGLNPDDPVDAFEDQDGDGISALDEFDLGTNPMEVDTDGDGLDDDEEIVEGDDNFITNPVLADTDGDGLNDGVEAMVGSSPIDETDANFSAAIASVNISPEIVSLTFNAINNEVSTQLTLTANLIDGSQLDVTSADDTSYISDDLTVASFGATAGEVFGGAAGSTEVTASHLSYDDTVPVTVETFEPIASAQLILGGTGYTTAVYGDTVYVAGSTGLIVIDVTDRSNPFIVSTFATTAAALDVKVFGTTAYVAVGGSGLDIIDITNPTVPVLITNMSTSGSVVDLAVDEQRVYLGEGNTGMEIIDVSNPAVPISLSVLGGLGNVVGIDVEGPKVVVVSGSNATVIDVSVPSAPVVGGSVNVGSVRDVAVNGDYAYVAAYNSGYRVVRITDTAVPVDVGGQSNFYPTDVALTNGFALFADTLAVNAVPYVNIGDPENAAYQGRIDMSAFGDRDAQGLSVDASFAYLTGSDRFYIAQFRLLSDTFGNPPEVEVESNDWSQNLVVLEGQPVTLRGAATDDVAVAAVSFYMNGELISSDTSSPFQAPAVIPVGATSLNFHATAVDLGGNVGVSVLVSLKIQPDGDLDGLGDAEEIDIVGTDPTDPDTDGDGLLDGEEVKLGISPLNVDSDDDGIEDGEEVIAGVDGVITDPANADSDGDGLSDSYEIDNGYNPVNASDGNSDTDTDGLTLAEEFVAGTDPDLADTDSDLMSDGYEVEFGLDPLDDTDGVIDSDGDGLTNAEEAVLGSDPFNDDIVPPEVVSLESFGDDIFIVTFSEALRRDTVNASNIALYNNGIIESGEVVLLGLDSVVQFTLTGMFDPDANYSVAVRRVRDLASNLLQGSSVFGLNGQAIGVDFEPNNSRADAFKVPLVVDPVLATVYTGVAIGDIGAATDTSVDYFSFDAVAGDRVTINVHRTGASYYGYLYVYNAVGEVVASNGASSTPRLQNLLISATGTYYVRLSIYNNSYIGNYQFEILLNRAGYLETENNNNTSGADYMSLVSPTGLAGELSTTPIAGTRDANSDWFVTYLLQDDVLSVTVDGSSGSLKPNISVLNSASIEVAADTNDAQAVSASVSGYVVPSDGLYYVVVDAASGSGVKGFYTLTGGIAGRTSTTDLEDNNGIDDANPIELIVDPVVDTVFTGIAVGDIGLSTNTSSDYFSFEAEAGDRVSINAHRTSASYYGYIHLYDADGAQLATAGATQTPYLNDRTLASTGTYYIRIRSYNSSYSGSYQIEVILNRNGYLETETNNNTSTADYLSLFSPSGLEGELHTTIVAGAKESANSDFFVMYLLKDDVLSLTVDGSGGTLKPSLTLLNSASGTVTADTNTGDTVSASISDVVIPGDGLYYLVIGANSGAGFTGFYTMTGSVAGRSATTDVEPNNDRASANHIELTADPVYGDVYTGVATGDIGLSTNTSNDYFSFDGVAGDRISINAHRTSSSYYGYISLYDADGTKLSEVGASSTPYMNDLTLPSTGLFYIRIRTYNNSYLGSYQIEVIINRIGYMESEPNNGFSQAEYLSLNSYDDSSNILVSSLVAGVRSLDSDWYVIYLLKDEQVSLTIDGSSGTLKPSVLIRDASNEVLSSNDNADLEVSTSLSNVSIPSDGLYYIVVDAASGAGYTGFYTLIATVTGRSVAADVEPNNDRASAIPMTLLADPVISSIFTGIASGDIGLSTDTSNDYYSFAGEAGDQVSIIAHRTSSNYYGYIHLYNAAGDELAIAGALNNPYINNISLPATETYYVRIRSYNNSYLGSYQIEVVLNRDGYLETEPNNNAAGADYISLFSPDGAVGDLETTSIVGVLSTTADWYVMYLIKGDVIDLTIDGSGGTLRPSLSLQNASGSEIAGDTNGGGTVSASISAVAVPADGLYYLIVDASSGAGYSGFYTITGIVSGRATTTDLEPNNSIATANDITLTANPAVSTVFSGVANGDIGLSTDTSHDYFSFDAVAGDRVSVTAHRTSSSYYGYIDLYDPNGALVATAGASNTPFMNDLSLTITGSYSVRIRVYNNSYLGSYQIEVLINRLGYLETEANNSESAADYLSLYAPGDGTLNTTTVAGALALDVDKFIMYLLKDDVLDMTVDGSGGTLLPTLSIQTAGAVEIAANSNAGSEASVSISSYTIPADGLYYVVVDALSGAGYTGFYTLQGTISGRTAATDIEDNDDISNANPVTLIEDPVIDTVFNGIISGDIGLSTNNTNDYFSFAGEAGDRVSVTAHRTSSNYYGYIHIDDVDGELAVAGASNTPYINNFRLPATATYYVRIRSYNNSYLGSYQIEITLNRGGFLETEANNSRSTADYLTFYSPTGSDLGTRLQAGARALDADFFRLYLREDETLDLTVQGNAGTLVPTINVQDSAGTILEENTNAGATRSIDLPTLTVPADGLYYAQINALSGAGYTGFYTLTGTVAGRTATTDFEPNSSRAAAQSVTLTVDPGDSTLFNGSISGDIGLSTDTSSDYFSIAAEAGDTVTVSAYKTCSNYYGYLHLYDAVGTQIVTVGASDTPTITDAAISAPGTYYIQIRPYNTGASYLGCYQIDIALTRAP